MRIKINGKEISERKPIKSEYSDAQGWAVIITGFSVIFWLLYYWGWFG